MSVPLMIQINAVRREIGYRERVYPRWVQLEKMTQDKADLEIAAMRAVLVTLQELHTAQNPELLG
jgi:hypothetical protein